MLSSGKNRSRACAKMRAPASESSIVGGKSAEVGTETLLVIAGNSAEPRRSVNHATAHTAATPWAVSRGRLERSTWLNPGSASTERGRLVIERIAGKDYTTLRNIGRMRELCRVESLGHASGCSLPTADLTATPSRPCGASKTVDTNTAQATALRIANRLITQHSRTHLRPTSASGRSRRGKATVVPIKSPSAT